MAEKNAPKTENKEPKGNDGKNKAAGSAAKKDNGVARHSSGNIRIDT
jgi:hypothetical protein